MNVALMSSVSISQAAERDWEEKRASLTQYSAQDINRLLEETQAELMKAIPDLDFAAKQIKPSSNTPSSQTPQSGTGTPEHRVSKPQHKLSGSKEGGSRRGSGKTLELRHFQPVFHSGRVKTSQVKNKSTSADV